MKWTLSTLEEWNPIAREIATNLRDGEILTLSGPLGVGKTTFVQELAFVLGAERKPKSPTFSMLRTYAISANGLSRMLHVDAYRIERETDLMALDLDEELMVPGTILVIEWPEQIPEWLSKRSHKKMLIELNDQTRTVHFQ